MPPIVWYDVRDLDEVGRFHRETPAARGL